MSDKIKGDDSDNEKKILVSETIEIKQEKKPDLPTKSSMEILSELFSTFDAEPPIIIKKEKSEVSSGKKHKKKKKHKHKEKKHKKKSRKRHCSNSSSSEGGKVDLAQILIKQEKDFSAKKIKIEGTDLSLNIDVNTTDDLIKKEESCESDSKTPVGSPKLGLKKSKIVIQDLKKSSVFEALLKDSQNDEISSDNKEKKHKKKHKQKCKKRSRSESKDRHEKKVKVNNLREKESKHSKHKNSDKSSNDDYGEKAHHKSRDRERSRERHYDRQLYDKYKDEYYRTLDDYKKSRKDNPFYRGYKEETSYQSNERDRDFRLSGRDRYM